MPIASTLLPLAATALLTLALSHEGQAASFDCARASTPHEKHLCADPALSAADGRMGQSYRAAAQAFPVKGFVQATQRRFLVTYPSCDRQYAQSCKSVIEARIAELDAMRNSTVFPNGEPGAPFSPDDGVFWMTTDRGAPTIHYFGSFMPDMNVPEPFPQGFVCDDSAPLRTTPTGWTAADTRDEITVSGTEVRAEISCSARNGLYGTYKRVEPPPAKPPL